MACLSLFVFLASLIASAFPPCYVHGIISCIETEKIALLSIKAGINHSHDQSLFSSWTGHDCCKWQGVSCNQESLHVIKLDLRQHPSNVSSNLDLPPSKLNSSLVQLHHLKHLDLSMNNFNESRIPDFIGSFANLEYLNLSNAGFSGAIPHAFGNLSCLRYLDLNFNLILQPNDLHWLSGMTSLHYLDLSAVDLSNVHGWLHDINSVLPSLRVLKLSYAELQGGGIYATTDLPHYLNFTSLRVLDLSGNYHLNITLPQWLFNLTSLVHLDLSECTLYGKLPGTVGNLSRLRVFSLSGNSFGGVIPESFGNLNCLERLDLSRNKFIGSIPESLSNLTNLVYFDMFANKIGKLPESIGMPQKLVYFDLSSNQVQGWMPASIGDLRNLQYLDLSWNMISGVIPESFGNLTLLQHFNGAHNKLSGKLPETMGNFVHLQFLDLSQNAISGKLPESFGNLSQLQYLSMQDNGTLPKNMGNLCKLQTLDLTSNMISGGIDNLVDGLSKCRENKDGSASDSREGLKTLNLGNNMLNGTIPENIGKLAKLFEFDLSSNYFMGVLTESHFVNLVNLTYLDLSYNSLQLNVSENWKPPFDCWSISMCSVKVGPPFPTWIKTQTYLSDLCLSDAGISGNLPAWFGYLSPSSNYGYVLNLSNNNLEGRLPTSLKNYTFYSIDLSSNRFEGPLPELDPSSLDVIHLNNNSFSGSTPSYFANATFIRVVSLSDNHISGNIPSFICNLTTLELFDVSNNDMSGPLPKCWNSASVLQIIHLSDNNFTGKIPDALVSLTNLRSLHLRNNGFSGGLPLSLKMANKLIILDVGENKLSGSIPTWIGENLSSLKVLCLRSNYFEGIIPEQLSKLSSLQILDLADNNLSGCIPHSFGDFKVMAVTNHNESLFVVLEDGFSTRLRRTVNFTYWESLMIVAKGLQIEYSKLLSLVTSIDLSNNKLSCDLPEELTKLHGLHFLNLSGNLFNGRIPKNIGDMKQLESLDLSKNNLFGTIPSSISTLNFLAYLNVSHNNLSGKIPSGTQLQSFDQSSYNWNHGLCGSPLQNCANETNSLALYDEDWKGDWAEMLWFFIGLAMGFITGFWMIIGTIISKQTIRIAYFRSIDKVYDWIYVKAIVYSRRLKLTFTRRN